MFWRILSWSGKAVQNAASTPHIGAALKHGLSQIISTSKEMLHEKIQPHATFKKGPTRPRLSLVHGERLMLVPFPGFTQNKATIRRSSVHACASGDLTTMDEEDQDGLSTSQRRKRRVPEDAVSNISPIKSSAPASGRTASQGGLVIVPHEQQSPTLAQRPSVELPGFDARTLATDAVVPISGWKMTELILGRLAMAGFAGAVAVQLATGWGVTEQFARFPDNVALIAIAVASSSLIVRRVDPGLEVRFLPAFSLHAELINGRLAMLGFTGLVCWELISHFIYGGP